MARGKTTTPTPAPAAAADARTGPPLLVLALGYLSVAASIPSIGGDGIPLHVVGYVIGGLLPILVVGLVRRIDLDRRRSAGYRPQALVGPALVLLAVVGVAAAGLHIWPIATELAT